MDEITAIQLVVANERQSFPKLTEDEAVEHARNTITLEMLGDETDELTEAYRLLLGRQG